MNLRALRACVTAAILLFAGLSPAAAQSTVVISQVYGGGGNSGATLTHDFIELFNYGPDPVPLDGWSVQYASTAGASWQVTPLTGTLLPGQYFLVQEAQGAGGSVSLPLPDATGAIPMAAGAAKVALVNSTTPLACGGAPGNCFPNAAIQDFVGYGTANNFEGGGAAPGLSNTTAALRLGDGCVDTNVNAADFASGTPLPRNRAVFKATCGPVEPPTCTPDTTIGAVQGSGQSSPRVGETVSVAGIVTGRITTGSARGFFVQMPAEGDGDPATSDGVFVFTGSATPPADAAIGNEVCVSGPVAEFAPTSDPLSLPLTEISRPTVVTLIATGLALPEPVTLTPALTPLDQPGALERFEGMRVHAASLTVVAPTDGSVSEPNATSTSNGLFFGVLTGIARPQREPGLDIFDALPPGAPPTIPRFDSNPERLRVDSDALGAPAIDVATGMTVSNLVGPLHYGFRTWSILPDANGTPIVAGAAAAVPVPAPTAREFTVASTNLERFFDAVNQGGDDVVLTEAALERRLAKVSLAIRTVLQSPDILGIVEAENLLVLQALADRVNADALAGGQADPGYEAFLVEGNDIGGIDVGFLVKSSRVTVEEVTQVGGDATWINPDGEEELLNDRPPLVLRAIVTLPAGPLPVTVIANHLRSLIDIETAAAGPRVRAKRRAQAEFLAQYIQARQQANPQERIVSVGDYNAFQFNDGYVDVLGTVKGTPAPPADVTLASPDLVNPDLVNAIEAMDPLARYSYVFDGNAQVLDHVLLNAPALANLTRVRFAHNNADFPELLRNDPTRPERYSDHDIPIAYFQVMPSDVSARLRTLDTGYIRVPFLGFYLGAILIQNTSNAPITGPIHLVFENLPAGISVMNATGDLFGAPYITVPSTNVLRPGQIAAAVVQISNPNRRPITYTLRTVAGAF